MKKLILSLSILGLLFSSTCSAEEMEPMDVYNHMIKVLGGEWSLSSVEKQTGTSSYKNPAISHLAGTKENAIAYRVIGRGATLQEDLLTNTKKEMVTMYHCDNFFDCKKLKATHYCAKRNQPQFLLNTKETTKTKIVFDCDMSTQLCNSNQDHVHKIIHQLSQNGTHLKSSYLGWKNQTPNKKNSIYHFDKK